MTKPRGQLTQTQIIVAIVVAVAIVAVGWWLVDQVQTTMFVSDCERQGGIAKVFTLTGQKFCDIP